MSLPMRDAFSVSMRCDAWLEDPEPGDGWPSEIDLRVSGRPAVYRLDRSQVAGLGVEGDLLLGWRSGDVIASELR